jgi:MFS family permease
VRSNARLRRIAFALGVTAFGLAFFHRVAPAALAEELTRAFEASATALGVLAATYFYVYALMQLPTGVLVDTLGPRRVLAAGTLLAGAGSLVFALSDSFLGAAMGRTLVGLGVSVAFVCVLKINANWFDERRFATATGWANLVGIVGAFAATAPLAWLITAISWRTLFALLGLFSLAHASLTIWKLHDAPGDAPRRAVAPSGVRWHEGLLSVIRNRATWPAFWVNFGLSGVNMSFIGLWAVPFLVQTYGFSLIEASRHTSVMLAGYAVSTVLVGWASDRLERRRPLMIVLTSLYLLCWLAWLAGVPPGWTYPLAGAMGILVSGLSLSWACGKEVNAPEHAGMATSFVNMGGFLAAGILQPLVGWVLDATGHFGPALLVFTLFAACGLAGALFITETRCRNIWRPQARLQSKVAGPP